MNEQFFTSLNGYKVKDEYAIHTYDTVANMKADTKLKEGMHVKSKGYYEVGDNGDCEYLIVNDNSLVDDGGSIHEIINNLFAVMIPSDEINLKMFGAKLDGTNDDTEAVINAFKFANENNLKVVQKSGILYIPTATIDNCPIINVDCDFTGLKIKFDENSDSQTVMIIADPETLSNNTIQEIQLTNTDILELTNTNTNPINFLENYKNHYVIFETDMKVGTRSVGYGEDVYYSQGFEVNDLQQLTPNNMYADISSNATEVKMKYLPLSQRHLTIKLPEINIDGNVENNPMILVMRNNVDLLDCIITKTNYTNTTEWVQPLFRCRYCCNLTIKNWVGENISNEPTNTDITSYIIAVDKCFNVLYENNNLLKAHGCFVSYHTNFINFINNVCDRFDNHYGLFGNVNIINNSFISYPSIVNLGYGDGQVNIKNCSFYKYDENGKKVSGICIDNRVDLTAMYSGNINIEDIYVKGINLTEDERYTTLFQYIPTKNENSIFPTFVNYNFPNIFIKNIKYDNYNMFYRTAIFHNNNDSDKKYNLRSVIIDNTQEMKYTTQLDFGDVDTTNAYIKLNKEKCLLYSKANDITVILENDCDFRSLSSNIKCTCISNGNNNIIDGTLKYLRNIGMSNLKTVTVSETTQNTGRLYINTKLTTNKLNSSGIIEGAELDVTEGYISCRNVINTISVQTKLAIVGSYFETSNNMVNNGSIYLSGNYMYSGTASKITGTIYGNGNWAGANSNLINNL